MNNMLLSKQSSYTSLKSYKTWQPFLPLLLPLIIFLVALLPRVANLDTFLTADEDDQIMFASLFLKAALQGDLSHALVLGYPGVPTLILGATGIAARYAAHYSGWLPLPWVTSDLMTTLEATTTEFGRFTYPLDFIWWVRLPMVVAAAFSVMVIYLLARRLLGEPLALIGTLFIAFDPFILAHTRVVHVDAPLAYFMFIAFLAFLLYVAQGRGRYLVVAGMFAGLAALSKTGPSVFLGPILLISGLCYVLFYSGESRWQYGKRLMIALVGCGLLGGAAFFALWPTMWSQPLTAIDWIWRNLKSVNGMPHPTTGVFWGGRLTDQSPYYYLVVLPYHLTPLATVGIIGSLLILASSTLKRWRGLPDWLRDVYPFTWSLMAYVVLFVAPVSMVTRRGDRYILPVYFALAFLAAIGLWWMMQVIAHTVQQSRAQQNPLLSLTRLLPTQPEGLMSIALTGQILLVLTINPYYLAYYNPIMSLFAKPSHVLNIGWGEGLDEAARFLNTTTADEPYAQVAAWYSNQFAPYYHGYTVDLSDQHSALYSDYTVFYLNQVQRGFPSPEVLEYFRQREPLHIVTIGGVEYAWIYDGPVVSSVAVEHYTFPVGQILGGGADLLGVDVPETTFAIDQYNLPTIKTRPEAQPLFGDAMTGVPVTLHWKTINKIHGEHNVYIRLVDEQGMVWGQVDRLILAGLWRPDRWQPGFNIQDEYRLPIEHGTPPGLYHLEVGLYDFETGDTYGVAQDIGEITLTSPQTPPTERELPLKRPNRTPLDNHLTMLGHTYQPQTVLPGTEVEGKIFWELDEAVAKDYQLQFWLRFDDNTADSSPQTGDMSKNMASSFAPSMENGVVSDDGRFIIHETALSAQYPTSQWRAGERLGAGYQFRVSPYAPAGEYPLMVRVIEPESGKQLGSDIRLATMTVEEIARNYTLPDDVVPISASLNNEIELVGYKLHQTETKAEEPFGLSLYWRSWRPAQANYTVFVHVVGPDGLMRGQWDSLPVQGTAATSGWLPGEIIEDYHMVPMSKEAPPWKYDIFVGMYDADTGERLPMYAQESIISDNRVWLNQIQVVE